MFQSPSCRQEGWATAERDTAGVGLIDSSFEGCVVLTDRVRRACLILGPWLEFHFQRSARSHLCLAFLLTTLGPVFHVRDIRLAGDWYCTNKHVFAVVNCPPDFVNSQSDHGEVDSTTMHT